MSIPKRMTVNCPKCGKQLSATVFESVNSDYADDIAMQIMSGDLFNVECPHCKFVSHLEYDILYHDLRHGAMIWVVHNNSPEYTKRVSEIRAMPKLPHKTFRIVNDMNALKEKVSCLESNRDDRIVELCKVFCAYNLLSQRPDFDFKVAFYTAVSGKEMIYLYDNDGNNICCELHDKAYEYLKGLYNGSLYAAQFDDNYPIVDYDWAENIFIPLLEAEVNNLPAEEEIYEEEKHKQELEKQRLIEQRRQEELERQHITEIQKERNLAILKRVAVQETADKRKKIIKIMVICVAVALITIGIIIYAFYSAHNSELRNFVTETMSEDYTNVYADIVSMEPEYFIYTSYNNTPHDISKVICECNTVEGKTIWVVVDIWKYPGGSSTSEEQNEAQYYSKSDPKRIVGKVTTSEKVMDELESRIGDIFVLDVTEKINK